MPVMVIAGGLESVSKGSREGEAPAWRPCRSSCPHKSKSKLLRLSNHFFSLKKKQTKKQTFSPGKELSRKSGNKPKTTNDKTCRGRSCAPGPAPPTGERQAMPEGGQSGSAAPVLVNPQKPLNCKHRGSPQVRVGWGGGSSAGLPQPPGVPPARWRPSVRFTGSGPAEPLPNLPVLHPAMILLLRSQPLPRRPA